MTGETEAAANIVTGAVLASAVEPQGGSPAELAARKEHTVCPNCGSALTGAYCASCGQPAHIHRSIGGLAHDILHAVFHFEGKLWRTVPELVIHPGRLTRRYVHGERAKFVSPLALYLFTVFLMYAVFSLTGPPVEGADWKQITADATRDAEIDLKNLPKSPASTVSNNDEGSRWSRLAKGLTKNPDLVSYKVKVNGYKYSWALIPLSLPFMWLMFLRRRDVHMYDHAIFVTYSITFMMLLTAAATLVGSLFPSTRFLSPFVQLAAVVHIYQQLRAAYGLSAGGALLRVFPVLLAAGMVLTIFVVSLVLLGALE